MNWKRVKDIKGADEASVKGSGGIFRTADGWWVTDESYESAQGPYSTKAQADRTYRAYCDSLRDDPADDGWAP